MAAAERVAIIGPSGGGKSTLLMAIAGFIAPESGRVLWQGVERTGCRTDPQPGQPTATHLNIAW